MIIDIATQRPRGETLRERLERESLADLLEQVDAWRTEILDTVPLNGRRIQLLDRIIKNLKPTKA